MQDVDHVYLLPSQWHGMFVKPCMADWLLRSDAFLLQDNYALFTPHFMIRKCSYSADSTECTTNCINNGRYCAVDSIDDAYSRKFQGWQVSFLQSHHRP